jgi:hypothetical protein
VGYGVSGYLVFIFVIVQNKSFWTVSAKYNPYLTFNINQMLPFSKKDLTIICVTT